MSAELSDFVKSDFFRAILGRFARMVAGPNATDGKQQYPEYQQANDRPADDHLSGLSATAALRLELAPSPHSEPVASRIPLAKQLLELARTTIVVIHKSALSAVNCNAAREFWPAGSQHPPTRVRPSWC